MSPFATSLFLLVALLPLSAAPAQEANTAETPSPPEVFRSSHSVEIEGRRIRYEATAGKLTLADEDGKDKAHVFFVAYTRQNSGQGDEAPNQRPITFCFNGGPGSSSVWLHMGAFGPRRVAMDPDGFPLPPPYRLLENEYSLLDVTDLVFIDPVTTGFSRAAAGEDDGQFHGVREDVESVGKFIHQYVNRYDRWSSPKFLAGESYGTTRSAGLVHHLQDRYGMYFNGVILISSILDFQTARFDRGNDLPYILFLPTYTATAWYHGQLDTELQQDLGRALEQAETFALGEYASALLQGDRLSAERRRAVAAELARLTGLSQDFVERANLRVNMSRFPKELRRDAALTVGRLDSRFTGSDYDEAGERYEFDPSYAAILGPYAGTLNDYVRRELGYQEELPYEILTGRVQPWNFGSAQNRYLNVADDLRRAMTRNRDLKVFVANGYYDLATPYFATEYTFSHLGLPKALQDNVAMGYYESGHMMYIHLDSMAQLKADLAKFVQGAVR